MKAKIEIFDGYGQDGSIIFKAATTCYRSEEKTQRTADDFIKMLRANGHMSMLEFSWFPVLMDFYSIEERNKTYNSLLELKLKYIEFYPVYASRILLYGNGRAWLDFFNHDLIKYDENYLNLVVHISKALNAVNPELFEKSFDDLYFKTRATCLNEIHYKNNSLIYVDNWVAVKFSNVSRGFCYDDKTEVLTKNGWKLFKDTSDADEFFTVDMKTKNVSYQKRISYIEEPWDSELLYGESSMVDFAVTPNHRMVYYPYDKRLNKEWKIDKAENIYGKRIKFQRGMFSKWCGNQIIEEYPQQASLDFARFMGIWFTDGCIYQRIDCSSGTLSISQTKEHGKIFIEKVLKSLGWSYYIKNSVYYITFKQDLYKFLREQFPYGKIRKIDIGIPLWIKQAPIEYINAFLEGCVVGDGNIHKKNRHIVLYAPSMKLAGDYQELFLKSGLCSTIRIDNRVGLKRVVNGSTIENRLPCYIVSVTQRTNEHLFNRKHWIKKHYKGLVYCVTVPNGTLYVRRNGKSFWSGNTHELVRHRTMSFAQASTRYIDNRNFDCIMPDVDTLYPDMPDEQKEKMLRIFAGVKNNLNLDYNYLLDHGIKKQDARQILPIGIANEICVAGTIKNWKHVFELRCSPAAHWEIREVMEELKKEFEERGLL